MCPAHDDVRRGHTPGLSKCGNVSWTETIRCKRSPCRRNGKQYLSLSAQLTYCPSYGTRVRFNRRACIRQEPVANRICSSYLYDSKAHVDKGGLQTSCIEFVLPLSLQQQQVPGSHTTCKVVYAYDLRVSDNSFNNLIHE
jgi:hypothetical protein